MTVVLWIGTALGAMAGLLHGLHLYRRWAAWPGAVGASPTAAGRRKAIYRSLWALAIWTLFGSYLLVLWILGALGYSVSRLFPRRGTG